MDVEGVREEVACSAVGVGLRMRCRAALWPWTLRFAGEGEPHPRGPAGVGFKISSLGA